MINNIFSTDISKIHSESLLDKDSKTLEKLNNKKLEKVAKEFESLLIYKMFKEMDKNISFKEKEYNPLFKKNQTEKIFNDFLTYEKSKIASQTGNLSLGLADTIIKQYKNRF